MSADSDVTSARRSAAAGSPGGGAEADPRRYLDPRVLGRIHRLEMRSRLVVEGFLAGLHRSPYQGLSVEFAQHREYVPGDDTKFIDWRVFSRTDRYYLKQYEAETNLRCMFLVDASRSMKYTCDARRREGLSKFHYAACIAASLSVLLLRQQDAVGIATFDEDWITSLPPSANPGQTKAVCRVLEEASKSLNEKTSIERVCLRASESLGHRGIVCLISDLLVDDREAMMRALIRLAHRGHDVLVLHVLDNDELTFPYSGNTRFVAMEEQADLTAEGRTLRDGYLAALDEFLRFLKRGCIRNRMDYGLVNTSEPLGAVLARFLARREAFGRHAAAKKR